MTLRVAINGFGRIGRQVARILCSAPDDVLELVAVNTLETIEISSHLLAHDTLYGRFPGKVEAVGGFLRVDGAKIIFLNEPDFSALPWTGLGVDAVFDCSGAASDAARLHLSAGASKVLLTRAAAGVDATLCKGLNERGYRSDQHNLVSTSSCTATCIGPVAAIIHERYTVDRIMATVVHSYTSQQHVHDMAAAGMRMGRAAAVNMIPAESSATCELEKFFPEMRGRVSVTAVRVPTPLVHCTRFIAKVREKVNRSELLAAFDEAADGRFFGILAVNRTPLVSSDFIGSSLSSIVDAEFTCCQDDMVSVLIWHDNEHGYSSRVVDLARHMATLVI